MVLLVNFHILDFQGSIRSPHNKWNLKLLSWGYGNRYSVHIQAPLSERFAMIRNIHHATPPLRKLLKLADNLIKDVIRIKNRIVIAVYQFSLVGLGHFHRGADRCEFLEFRRVSFIV